MWLTSDDKYILCINIYVYICYILDALLLSFIKYITWQ